jgi:hypothetical protein
VPAAAHGLAQVPALELAVAVAARRRQDTRVDENGAGDDGPGEEHQEGEREGDFPGHAPLSDAGLRGLRPGSTMGDVGWIAIGLLVAAVLVVIGAEWPRLSERIGADAWAQRSRRRRKEKLTLIRGEEEDDEFVKSVERDLADLPVWDEHEDRPRR